MTSSRGSQAGSRARNLCAVLGVLLAFAAPLGAEDPKDLYERAEQARKTGKPRLSRVLFRQLLEEAPDHVDGHVGYQKLLQSQGKEPDLSREYEKLLEERPEPWAYYLLGRVLHDPPREEALYRKGLEKDPRDARLRKALASALRRQLRREEAEAEHREVLRLDPDDIDAHTAASRGSLARRSFLPSSEG